LNDIEKANEKDVLRKNKKLSIVNLDEQLNLRQMQIFSYAYLKRRGDVSIFSNLEFRNFFGIERYEKRYILPDQIKVKKSGLTYFDVNMLNEFSDKGKLKSVNIIDEINYDDGVFTVLWNQRTLHLVENWRDSPMILSLNSIKKFKSEEAWSLYEYLKSTTESPIGEVEIGFNMLRFLFNVESVKSYEKFANFRINVLDKAIKELNKVSEFTLEYDKVKSGKNIVAINLKWLMDQKILITNEQLRKLAELRTEMSVYSEELEDVENKRIYDLINSNLGTLTSDEASTLIKQAIETKRKMAQENLVKSTIYTSTRIDKEDVFDFLKKYAPKGRTTEKDIYFINCLNKFDDTKGILNFLEFIWDKNHATQINYYIKILENWISAGKLTVELAKKEYKEQFGSEEEVLLEEIEIPEEFLNSMNLWRD
jgi:initiator replication protein repB